MFWKKETRLQKQVDQKVEKLNEPLQDCKLFKSLEQNINLFDELFSDVDILISRRFQNHCNPQLDFCLYCCDGVVDSMLISEHIIKPLLLAQDLVPGSELFKQVRDQFVFINDIKESEDVKELIEAVTYGDTILLMHGSGKALILSSKFFALRGISEPDSEKVLNGPREGFNEGIMANLSLIRRRLRTHNLKLKFRSMGRQSATTVCVCYLDNIVNKKILKELYRRLDTIDMDAMIDSNYITEHITEPSLLGIPTCGYTERPDIVVAKLLEGRIAIIVDGTPMVLTLPYLFIENFQSNEDYYLNHFYATCSRLLRLMGFFFTIAVPALYVAIVAFHHQVLQTPLMVNVTNERQGVPLPAFLECFIMLIIFDILRETGIRTPSHIGQALSIVGALVIGQSAVEAKLVAAPMIIVVAFTGITNLLVQKVNAATLFCRYFFLVLSSLFGLTGLLVAASLLAIHIFNLESFGVPILLHNNKLQFQDIKDTFVRAPWPDMLTRTSPISGNVIRSRPKKSTQEGAGSN